MTFKRNKQTNKKKKRKKNRAFKFNNRDRVKLRVIARRATSFSTVTVLWTPYDSYTVHIWFHFGTSIGVFRVRHAFSQIPMASPSTLH